MRQSMGEEPVDHTLRDARSAWALPRRLALPLLVYVAFFIVRVAGVQPGTDAGLGDFITALNLVFGGSVAYFTYILGDLGVVAMPGRRERAFWFFTSVMLVFLAFDEVFMIHEGLGSLVGVSDAFPLAAYGAVLMAILWLHLPNFSPLSYVFLAGLVVLGTVSVAADWLVGEGLVRVLGREIDYEQLCESFGALSLACCLLTESVALVAGRRQAPSVAADGVRHAPASLLATDLAVD